LLGATRLELYAYALAHRLVWLEDPTNESRQHLRNRIRHDLLPALRLVRPTIDAELLATSRQAASWRADLASMVNERLEFRVVRDYARAALDVAANDLRQYSLESLHIVWPELASRIGLVLDRRGTRRAAVFTKSERVGARIQLSGGWELHRSRERLELSSSFVTADDSGASPLKVPMRWGRWTFEVASDAGPDAWYATLSTSQALSIRSWRPGDRLIVRDGDRLIARKVKYFLSDAAISGHIRARWPVVLSGDEIVWIPGVRRSDAATARSGGPVVTYVCDYLDRRS
jgi:tRNA(Ile)-lysidine synthase